MPMMESHLTCRQLASSLLLAISTLVASTSASNSQAIPAIQARHESHYNATIPDTPRARAVRKMSSHPGEMFFYSYWDFEGTSDQISPPRPDPSSISESRQKYTNSTFSFNDFQSPLLLHTESQSPDEWTWIPRSLARRGFSCPAGTNSCASIGRPNSCCQAGLQCGLVQDMGQGEVGCCPSGGSCTGNVAPCPAGYATCSEGSGGGCCIPGYACDGVGCKLRFFTVVQKGLMRKPTGVKVSTQVVVVGATTVTASPTEQPPSPTSTTPASTTTCPASYQACAASLGGGCCPPDHGTSFSVNDELFQPSNKQKQSAYPALSANQ